MRNRRAALALAAVGLVLVCVLIVMACAGPVPAARSGQTSSEEFHQTFALAPNGQVELANINGGVTISAWDSAQVKVDAVKRGDSDRLSECRIEVSATPQSIRIETKYPRRSNNLSVHYTLMVPRNALLKKVELINGNVTITGVSGGVHASVVNGTVRGSDVGGALDLSSVNGTVDANLGSSAKRVRLSSVNGTVVLTAPSDLQAEVKASTVNGSIRNDFGLPVQRGHFVGANMNGRLGAGAGQIELSTVNGSIDLRHASDGKPLSSVGSASEGSSGPL